MMEISENSRVWIYQSDRVLEDTETARIQTALNQFTAQWLAHGHQLVAKAAIKYNRFIILIVDENMAGATGCSIDKSVNLMKQIEQEFCINLFDRFNIAYRDENEIKSVDRAAFERLITDGEISADTIVFNNLVQTLKEFGEKWEVPFKDSWHQQLFGNLISA